ncbi:MAG: hypothetical protein HQK67_07780 [Desulfamplus sp.]|nr:hypothetical protein [Desulfamplus sp.]
MKDAFFKIRTMAFQKNILVSQFLRRATARDCPYSCQFNYLENYKILTKMLILFLSVSIFSILGLSLTVLGCGKKGDPLPPLAMTTVPEPPTQLEYSIHSNQNQVHEIWLKWSHSSNKNNNKINNNNNKHNHKPDIKGVEIFRATLRLSEDTCKRCPLEFEKIASVSFPLSEYRQSIEKGFIYFYKVRCFTGQNISSRFSETIEFEFN